MVAEMWQASRNPAEAHCVHSVQIIQQRQREEGAQKAAQERSAALAADQATKGVSQVSAPAHARRQYLHRGRTPALLQLLPLRVLELRNASLGTCAACSGLPP